MSEPYRIANPNPNLNPNPNTNPTPNPNTNPNANTNVGPSAIYCDLPTDKNCPDRGLGRVQGDRYVPYP